MATKQITFKVTAADGMAYWLAVDEHDVSLTSGTGSILLDDTQEHILVWWMVGSPGDPLSVVGSDGPRAVVTVKESKIPDKSNKGAGYRKFKV